MASTVLNNLRNHIKSYFTNGDISDSTPHSIGIYVYEPCKTTIAIAFFDSRGEEFSYNLKRQVSSSLYKYIDESRLCMEKEYTNINIVTIITDWEAELSDMYAAAMALSDNGVLYTNGNNKGDVSIQMDRLLIDSYELSQET